MWVSKKRWSDVLLRLEELEGSVAILKAERYFRVCEKREPTEYGKMAARMGYPGSIYPINPPSADISVKNVVQGILNRLGMRLEYVGGQPEKVEIKKVK